MIVVLWYDTKGGQDRLDHFAMTAAEHQDLASSLQGSG
jgi:hypothetical protein